MFANLQRFLSDPRKKNLLIGGLLLFGVALTVILAGQQTSDRQRASEVTTPPFPPDGNITLSLSAPQNLGVGQTAPIDVFVNAGDQRVSGVSFTLSTSNPNILPIMFGFSYSEASVEGRLDSVIKSISSPTSYTYTAVNTTGSMPTGRTRIARVFVRPTAQGSAEMTFSNVQITALGHVDLAGNVGIGGTFQVGTPTIPTNTPIPTSVPTNTPVPPTGTPVQPTTTPLPPVVGDANGDRIVNILDYNIWRDEFLGTLPTKTSDFNSDGVIDLLDFNIWRTALGS